MGISAQGQMVIGDKISLLQEGEISDLKKIAVASNASIYCTVTLGDQQCHAIYKPIAGERPLWDFPDGNLASREYGTYLIDQALGFNSVPPTVLREGPFGLGAVQLWIENLDEWGDKYLEESDQLRKIALLDVIVNNTDRKIGHLLFKGDAVYACDHGVTFHKEYKLRTVLWQFAEKKLAESELLKLANLSAEIPAQLSELLTRDEVAALKFRISKLLQEKQFPLPPKDWPAIPWPPF